MPRGHRGSPDQNTARQILRIKLGDTWSSRTVSEREGVLPRPHTLYPPFLLNLRSGRAGMGGFGVAHVLPLAHSNLCGPGI